MLVREKVQEILAAWWQQVLPEENKGVRGVGSVVAVGAAETVCVLHAGVPGCVKRFSLVRKHGQLKRILPLLLVLWIVILSRFVLFFQCRHSRAFRCAARHDTTRVVSDGGDAVVSTRLSRAAASIYLERRRDPPASSFRFRRFLF
mmetsp:Transcript_66386/g.107691  ORF Transcript_66386/g.107691 Transcript_66386/m.107691 type:complete len:146 (+) Transcript_66386:513-950(+)